MNVWTQLTVALDELANIREQLGEARATERTARFYKLVRTKLLHTERGGHVADVIELSGGWVLLHWLHDPKSISLYSTIDRARVALSLDGAFLFILSDIAERTTDQSKRVSHVNSPLTHAERYVLIYLRRGLSNKEIALATGVRETTIKNHLSAIYKKFGPGADCRLQAALHVQGWDLDDPKEMS